MGNKYASEISTRDVITDVCACGHRAYPSNIFPFLVLGQRSGISGGRIIAFDEVVFNILTQEGCRESLIFSKHDILDVIRS